MRLHVPVHYALAVTEVQCLQQLIDIETDVIVLELRVQAPEVGIVDIFENQRRCFTLQLGVSSSLTRRRGKSSGHYPIALPIGAITDLVVANNVQQRDDIRSAGQILENLDLSLYLLLLNRLQNLNDAFLVVDDVDAFENFRVLAAT